jgi:hypothetical protein
MIKKLLAAAGLLAVVSLFWGVGVASAHHPEVVATNVCAETGAVPTIQVVATAWETDWGNDHRVNNDVRIDVTGPGVNLTRSGSFAAPGYAITTTFAVPGAEGRTLTVRVTSVAPWGPNGEYGSAGEYRETTVTVAPPCPANTTTTTTSTVPPSSTTTAPPVSPTTTPPSTGTGSGSSATGTGSGSGSANVPVEVEGRVQTRDDSPDSAAAARQAQSGQLAFTGAETNLLVGLALGSLALGGALVGLGRRRHTTS